MIGYMLMFLMGGTAILVGTIFVALTVRHWHLEKKKLVKSQVSQSGS